MPKDCCHPVGAHKRLRIPDTYVSSLMLDRALDAIVRRVGTIDRNHDIPYLAGYSLDGKRIYIDRHLPESFPLQGPRDRGRPLSAAARGSREDADRPARPALSARPPDRDARRGGRRARRRSFLARLRPLHADLRQADGRRAADQAAARPRPQALPRRARLRPDAPHGRGRRRPEHPAHEESAMRRRLDRALATRAAKAHV